MDHYNKVEETEVIGFIEPQSMNFETKLGTAYKDFIRKQPAEKEGRKLAVQDMEAKTKGGIIMQLEVYNKAGEKLELE